MNLPTVAIITRNPDGTFTVTPARFISAADLFGRLGEERPAREAPGWGDLESARRRQRMATTRATMAARRRSA